VTKRGYREHKNEKKKRESQEGQKLFQSQTTLNGNEGTTQREGKETAYDHQKKPTSAITKGIVVKKNNVTMKR